MILKKHFAEEMSIITEKSISNSKLIQGLLNTLDPDADETKILFEAFLANLNETNNAIRRLTNLISCMNH